MAKHNVGLTVVTFCELAYDCETGVPVPYTSFGHITWIKQAQVLKSLNGHRGSQDQLLHFTLNFRLKHPEHHSMDLLAGKNSSKSPNFSQNL